MKKELQTRDNLTLMADVYAAYKENRKTKEDSINEGLNYLESSGVEFENATAFINALFPTDAELMEIELEGLEIESEEEEEND